MLDAGAFLAVERSDPIVLALLKGELVDGRVPQTHGGVVGQVWRGGRDRQVTLARLLRACEVVPLDAGLGRAAGVLLGSSGTADVVDAAVVLLARDGDTVLTSDPGDIALLAAECDLHVDVVPV